jgi:hypothetical protein
MRLNHFLEVEIINIAPIDTRTHSIYFPFIFVVIISDKIPRLLLLL